MLIGGWCLMCSGPLNSFASCFDSLSVVIQWFVESIDRLQTRPL